MNALQSNLTGLQILDNAKLGGYTPVFYTLEQLFDACAPHQITLSDLLVSRRIYLNGLGWSAVELSDELTQQIADKTAEKLGGQAATKKAVSRVLAYSVVPKHWGLSRMIVEKHSINGKCFLSYIAGQDYPSETAEIRTFLKKF